MYNPLRDGTIYLYPKNRSIRDPRIFLLETEPSGTEDVACATACKGKVIVYQDKSCNVQVTVNGKPTERYSILYNGKTQRKLFGTT